MNSDQGSSGMTRRTVIASGAAGVVASGAGPLAGEAEAAAPPRAAAAQATMPVRMTVNGKVRSLSVDPRVTLLDALREHLDLTGSKKGCDHGQCGACTVIAGATANDGRRINSCLSLAVMHDGDTITTIEGLGTPDDLHPMQAAFVKHDGYQCGYCTPGQIVSATATLREIADGVPSHVSTDLMGRMEPSETELRERMSGNICRCAAYANIIAAVREVAGQQA